VSGGPTVSVVLPVLNGAGTIGETLAALTAQAGPDVEILVVDNGSTDATREIAGRFDVRLLDQPRRGPSCARNMGLSEARGPIIVHVDADIVPTSRWLREIARPFADPAVVLVGGRTLTYPPQNAVERYAAQSGRFEPENNVLRDPFPFAPSQNLAVRRDAALAAGGWAEELPYAEDVDFCHRVLVAHQGSRIVFAPRAIAFHHERTTEKGLRRQAWCYGRGVADIYRRYPDVVRWDLPKTLRVGRVLMERGLAPVALGLGRLLGRVPTDHHEFAIYHRAWTWWWWRGFFSGMLTSGRMVRP
jgi:glycosyltransferase involved in cell wall biosynthesis